MSDDHEGDPGMTGSMSGDDVFDGGKLETPTPLPPLGPFQHQNCFLGRRSNDSVPRNSLVPDKICRHSQCQRGWLDALPGYVQAYQGT